MYELKAHAVLNRHVEKAEALVSKFRNQKPPENATREQMKEWERKKLTTGKVLGIIAGTSPRRTWCRARKWHL